MLPQHAGCWGGLTAPAECGTAVTGGSAPVRGNDWPNRGDDQEGTVMATASPPPSAKPSHGLAVEPAIAARSTADSSGRTKYAVH